MAASGRICRDGAAVAGRTPRAIPRVHVEWKAQIKQSTACLRSGIVPLDIYRVMGIIFVILCRTFFRRLNFPSFYEFEVLRLCLEIAAIKSRCVFTCKVKDCSGMKIVLGAEPCCKFLNHSN